jgi:hypothetical protein
VFTKWSNESRSTARSIRLLLSLQQVNPILAILSLSDIKILARGSQTIQMQDGDNVFLSSSSVVPAEYDSEHRADARLQDNAQHAVDPAAEGSRVEAEGLCIVLRGTCKAHVEPESTERETRHGMYGANTASASAKALARPLRNTTMLANSICSNGKYASAGAHATAVKALETPLKSSKTSSSSIARSVTAATSSAGKSNAAKSNSVRASGIKPGYCSLAAASGRGSSVNAGGNAWARAPVAPAGSRLKRLLAGDSCGAGSLVHCMHT